MKIASPLHYTQSGSIRSASGLGTIFENLGALTRIMQNPPYRFSWFIPIVWIALSFGASKGIFHWNRTRSILDESQLWIERFKGDYHRLPYNLAEVRALARVHKSQLTPYDSHGMRLQYLPFSEHDYLVKSFGSDEQENHLTTSVDPTFSTYSKKAETFVQPETLQQSIPQFYQPAFLDGSQSPESGLFASVEVHTQFKTRHLIVRSPKNSDFYMVAFHDMIEEFLWLPDGLGIIFTAFGSQRYEDGIFYWDLKDNTFHNLLPALRNQFWPNLVDDMKFYSSLSHVSQEPALIYLLLTPAESEDLDPKKFFSFKNLIALPLGEGLTGKMEGVRIQTELAFTAFDYDFTQSRLLKTAELASPVQQEWLALSLEGDAEMIINQWQDFSSKNASNAMCVYGLWWLSSIYNDAYRQLSQQGSPEAHVIRNFGIEMTDALIGMPTTPRYLGAMGRYLKKNLLLSRAADYNVTSLPKIR